MAKKNRKRQSSAAVAVEPLVSGPGRRAREAAARQSLPLGSPGGVGSVIGIVFGIGIFALGLLGAMKAEPLPVPLILALCVGGALQTVLCWQTIRRSRTAWSFAVSLSGTTSLVCIFGSPKISSEMGASLTVGLIPALLAVIVTCMLVMAAADVSSQS